MLLWPQLGMHSSSYNHSIWLENNNPELSDICPLSPMKSCRLHWCMVSAFKSKVRSQSLFRNWQILQPTIELMCLICETIIQRWSGLFVWRSLHLFLNRWSATHSYHNRDHAGLPATCDLALSWLLIHSERELMHSCCSLLKRQLLPIAVLPKGPVSIHCSTPAVRLSSPGLCDPDEITAFELQTDLIPPASSPCFLQTSTWDAEFLEREKYLPHLTDLQGQLYLCEETWSESIATLFCYKVSSAHITLQTLITSLAHHILTQSQDVLPCPTSFVVGLVGSLVGLWSVTW